MRRRIDAEVWEIVEDLRKHPPITWKRITDHLNERFSMNWQYGTLSAVSYRRWRDAKGTAGSPSGEGRVA